MKKVLILLVLAAFFALTTLAMAESTRDGPIPAIHASDGNTVIESFTPPALTDMTIAATMHERASPNIQVSEFSLIPATATGSSTTAQEVLSFAQGTRTMQSGSQNKIGAARDIPAS